MKVGLRVFDPVVRAHGHGFVFPIEDVEGCDPACTRAPGKIGFWFHSYRSWPHAWFVEVTSSCRPHRPRRARRIACWVRPSCVSGARISNCTLPFGLEPALELSSLIRPAGPCNDIGRNICLVWDPC